nr:nuclear pore complex protein NUP50A [Ipomoea batatas]GMC73309.1 nuclear pore complex protein NUP50A [Ipomoea batatas]
MGDAENALPPSKKRAAGREISRDNPGLDDDDETSELETGTFQKASDEVMASRRIVRVRRQQTSSTPSAPSSNPFAGIRLVSPAPAPVEATDKAEGAKSDKVEEKQDANEKTEEAKADVNKEKAVSTVDKNNTENEPEKLEAAEPEKTKEEAATAKVENEIGKDAEGEKTENEDEKPNGNEVGEKSAETPSFSSFQQLSSSQNAFTGLAGTGFSGSTFSFGAISKEDSGSPFGVKSDQPSFSFGSSNNGSVSLFGEENEKPVFTADSVLFEYLDGGWKERGKGEIKVNVSTTEVKKARLVMRSRGNYRLILNANLFPEMKLANMDKKGITFACVNSASETSEKLSTFALKFKDASIVEEFRAAVVEHKGGSGTPPAADASLKTPENSPKAAEV